MDCKSMLLITNQIHYFKTFQIHFPTASLIFTAVKLFDQVTREQTKDEALTTSHAQWQLF